MSIKDVLKANALSISAGAAVIGSICAVFGLVGYFDTLAHYCDTRSNPCTAVTVPVWFSDQPTHAKFVRVTQGLGLLRTASGVTGLVLCAGGFVSSLVAADNQRRIDERKALNENQQHSQREILVDEEMQKRAIAADLRVKDFRRELLDGYAVLRLEDNPELVEALTASPDLTKTNLETETVEIKTVEALQPTPKQHLLKLVREYQSGWMLQTMKRPTIIYGEMGSFKSYLTAFLTLCKHYCFDMEMAPIVDLHFHQNKTESWESLVRLGVSGLGANQNTVEVLRGIENYFIDFANRTKKDPWKACIFDEVTNYKNHSDLAEVSKHLLPRTITDPRKANVSPIMIAHNMTQSALGGAEGMADAKDKLLMIELFSTVDKNGDYEPTFNGKAYGFRNLQTGELLPEMDISIKPDWIRPDWVYQLFNQPQETKQQPTPKATTDSSKLVDPSTGVDPDRWQRIFNLEFDLETKGETNNSNVSPHDETIETSENDGDSQDVDAVEVSENWETGDSSPESYGFPPLSALLQMLRETRLPASAFIKETLKAKKKPKYQAAKKYIAYVLRRYGDFELMQKFKDCLKGEKDQ